jgi:phosphatidate cytidylyltransferase
LSPGLILRLTDSPDKKISVLRKRLISSVIAVPVVAVIIWFGGHWGFAAFAAVWGAGGAYEYYNILKRSRGVDPLTYFGLVWIILLIISPNFATLPHFGSISPASVILASGIILPLLILLWRKGKENAFANWAWTVGGILYIGWLVSYLVALRIVDHGRDWVLLTMVCTFTSDSCAYLIGRTFGRHKLAPFISPHKTWEGTIGGLLPAVAVTVLLVWLLKLPVGYGLAVLLGVLLSGMGQLGDLVKSLFKRNMEIKDSGNVLPGHGGFLDRMDSVVFAGVTVYFFVLFIQAV